ncbi:MAG: TetR/AcrR family transcriptional regulator [Treponemataceae bacterium]|nr:TetR/AcrR family transcriptional regulator [Treponemataceae bacterium]
MARRIIGVSKRLLQVAREEFLQKGFEGASIREIAKKAETSPRALYTRFENKEELFAAVVEPSYSSFMDMFHKDKKDYWDHARNKDFSKAPEDYYKKYLDFVYERRDDFILILKCSQGTRFSGFSKKLGELDLQSVRENAPDIIKDFKIDEYDQATKLFLESITYAFYDDLFAPLVKGIDLQVAKDYITKLTKFYNGGLPSFYAPHLA